MSASNESYKQFKLIKELVQKQDNEYINDFSNVDEFENSYCDFCDRKLIQYKPDTLICAVCQIPINIQFSIVRRKAAKQGPVDIEDVDDFGSVSEYYNFKRQEEKKDPFIDSIKAKGATIIKSS